MEILWKDDFLINVDFYKFSVVNFSRKDVILFFILRMLWVKSEIG